MPFVFEGLIKNQIKMKLLLSALAVATFSISALTAQTTADKKTLPKNEFIKSEAKVEFMVDVVKDTLTLKTSKVVSDSVTAIKIGNKIFKLEKETPGQYKFVFNEAFLNELFRTMEQSTNGHLQVEQLKTVIREQLGSQVRKQ